MSVSSAIDQLAAGPELLAYSVAGLSDEMLRARPGPGAWSIAEVVAHMVDSDAVGIDRMKRVIAEENPTLMAYDQDAWIARLDSQSMPVSDALELFALNRKWIVRVLCNCTEADFARPGQHTETGPKTLATLVTGYVAHLDYHLKFVYDKRTNLAVPIEPRFAAS